MAPPSALVRASIVPGVDPLAMQETAKYQLCVPAVTIDAKSYRMRSHRERIEKRCGRE
jgi:hypothetical protein